jgi:Ca-activated chloride channel family protein
MSLQLHKTWGLAALLPALTACEAQFGQPHYLWGLWLVPLLVAFYLHSWRSRSLALQAFVAAPMAARLIDGADADPGADGPAKAKAIAGAGAGAGASGGAQGARYALRAGLMIIAVGACVLALAQPRWGFAWEPIVRQGVDIVVAVDVSDSMLVQDVQSHGQLSRLEQAKREIVDLLRLLHGDRIGLVAFAGQAFIECPLTLDYSAAAIFLEDIDTDMISVKGTALGEGIRTALTAMEGAEHTSQAIILITDGEDHGAEALQAAQEAKARGVRIYPIGIGRPEGAPIPLPQGGFHRDAQNNLILSKLDEATLQQVAKITDGLYTHSKTGEMDLEAVYTHGIKATLQSQQKSGKRRQRFVERFQYFLALACVALGLESFVHERRLGWRRRPHDP